MVSAWSRSGLVRPRISAGPPGLLWLAALLLSIAFTHGVSAESAEGHMTAGVPPVHASTGTQEAHASGAGHSVEVAYTSLEIAAVEDRHDGHGDGSSHPAQECVSGQPQQGLDLAAPRPAPLDSASPTRACAVGKSGPFRAESALAPLTGPRGSVVQQV